MLILSIETSCDETAAAVVEDGRATLTDQIFSQSSLHAVYGGVVPEIASRSHVEVISVLVSRALDAAGIGRRDIGAIAVTNAPGLIGALLVGVNFAKSAAVALGVPLIPVHHIKGHIASNYLAFPELEPPFACLVASGGHSLLIDVRDYTVMKVLGGTRDDAAGECFDKVARVLGLPYPGGPALDRLSLEGDAAKYRFPRTVIEGCPYDMSFSGLKTSVINTLHSAAQKGEQPDRASVAASFTKAVSDILTPRAVAAARDLGYGKLAVAGGVAANSRLRHDLELAAAAENIKLYIPPTALCGDNAAMIGSQGYFEFLSGLRADSTLNAFANLDI